MSWAGRACGAKQLMVDSEDEEEGKQQQQQQQAGPSPHENGRGPTQANGSAAASNSRGGGYRMLRGPAPAASSSASNGRSKRENGDGTVGTGGHYGRSSGEEVPPGGGRSGDGGDDSSSDAGSRHHSGCSSEGGADSDEDCEKYDRYGFMKEATMRESVEEYAKLFQPKLERRKARWERFVQTDSTFKNRRRLKRLCRKGIPDHLRSRVWSHCLQSDKAMLANPGHFRRNVAQPIPEPVAKQIDADLRRTFPSNRLFKEDAGIERLRKVLHAMAVERPEIGYCQALNFIAGIFLLFMNEELAFWSLVQFLAADDKELGLQIEDYYKENMTGVQVDSRVLQGLVAKKLPRLSRALEQQGVDISLIANPWFLTCFTVSLPISTTLRVWDALVFERDKVLFRVALAILRLLADRIEECSSADEVLPQMSSWVTGLVQHNVVMKTAFYGFGTFSRKTINQGREVARKQVEQGMREKELQRKRREIEAAERMRRQQEEKERQRREREIENGSPPPGQTADEKADWFTHDITTLPATSPAAYEGRQSAGGSHRELPGAAAAPAGASRSLAPPISRPSGPPHASSAPPPTHGWTAAAGPQRGAVPVPVPLPAVGRGGSEAGFSGSLHGGRSSQPSQWAGHVSRGWEGTCTLQAPGVGVGVGGGAAAGGGRKGIPVVDMSCELESAGDLIGEREGVAEFDWESRGGDTIEHGAGLASASASSSKQPPLPPGRVPMAGGRRHDKVPLLEDHDRSHAAVPPSGVVNLVCSQSSFASGGEGFGSSKGGREWTGSAVSRDPTAGCAGGGGTKTSAAELADDEGEPPPSASCEYGRGMTPPCDGTFPRMPFSFMKLENGAKAKGKGESQGRREEGEKEREKAFEALDEWQGADLGEDGEMKLDVVRCPRAPWCLREDSGHGSFRASVSRPSAVVPPFSFSSTAAGSSSAAAATAGSACAPRGGGLRGGDPNGLSAPSGVEGGRAWPHPLASEADGEVPPQPSSASSCPQGSPPFAAERGGQSLLSAPSRRGGTVDFVDVCSPSPAPSCSSFSLLAVFSASELVQLGRSIGLGGAIEGGEEEGDGQQQGENPGLRVCANAEMMNRNENSGAGVGMWRGKPGREDEVMRCIDRKPS
uniref:Rab-GAP TBC domain-containing protein n=1 Tax=Chromera velia CCMP2878 TaxID=1169474 RepID=A0A0G4FLG1_9ALVE|eukprot:Cvel_17475.t1-p1 / transcript=Cvel_17475.t1 / gene=Cvel_17475 / organism=Chromera_velia_CCMP2878 / gene_product=Growth hormone-regulated TBC protein 1, putative / transcript_product=Growth hormone-regulated TBC protein 1, putative / location=Cvel_scaffold1397:16918-21654(+) / protein_length=1120 / sequence_SO=supercontig / SO=protein_coding / is_pseudo=false